MSLKRILIGLVILFNAAVLVPVALPAGASAAANTSNCNENAGGFLGFPTWYKYLNPRVDGTECKIDFNIPQDVGKVAVALFEIVLRVAGLVAIGFVIYGGFQYIISQGEPDKIKGARTTIMNALIGLVIAISATAITNVIARGIA
jgi:hypothetical protein